MLYEPMIQARINSFRDKHMLTNTPDDKLFELFVNDTILHNHQPDIDTFKGTILDECSVGGSNDMGIHKNAG